VLRTSRALVAAAAIAALGTVLLYRHTLEYGFHYDDYHFVRPYPLSEIVAAFHGPWDSSRIELPFYRPLTVAFYAARFELFGLDSRAHHVMSLALFGLAAVLLAAFAWIASRRTAAAVACALFFTVHPSMPYALAAWITNQMHLVQTLTVLLALTWWSLVRRHGFFWWLPLLLLGGAAFLVKEDGVMLLPSVLALHWLWRRIVDPDLRRAPRGFVVLAAALVVALLAARADALEGLRSYGTPTLESSLRNFSRGLDRVFRLVPPDRPWQPAASWFATLLPVLGLLTWKRSPPELRFLLASGALLAVAFNLPFVFVTKLEQMHLVATGAVLVLAASAVSVVSALPPRAWRAAGVAVILAGAASLAAVARDISTDFAPFGPVVLAADEIVVGWAAVPEELREYLRSKRDPGAITRVPANPVEALDAVAFGLHPRERSSDGTTYRWMAQAQCEFHVSPSARYVELPYRHEIGAFREPTRVEVHVDGRLVDALVLDDDEWRVTRTPLRPDTGGIFRRSHRIRLAIPHSWIPADIIRGSRDDRTLGIKIGEIRIR
jgi:hypothetical protein